MLGRSSSGGNTGRRDVSTPTQRCSPSSHQKCTLQLRLTGNATEGEHDNRCKNAEHNDDDQHFNQREAVQTALPTVEFGVC